MEQVATIPIPDDRIKELIKAAKQAKLMAYAPYSKYQVGAALLTEDFRIFTGCNIENASYPAGNCAERTAIFKAVSEGCRSFLGIALVAGEEDSSGADLVSPCGICRQVLREFVRPEDFYVIMARNEEDYRVMTLEELLPSGFGPEHLKR